MQNASYAAVGIYIFTPPYQASRKRSGHHQIQVDKSQASKGDGLDMATLMRAGTVGMPKKAIDPATGHVMSVSRQAADLTVLVSRRISSGNCQLTVPSTRCYHVCQYVCACMCV